MKITFIRPHITARRAADALEPLAFGILAKLTPPDVEVVLHDARVEPVPLDEPTDLVALTVETFTAKYAYQLAAHYRARGIPVVMGGYHPTLLPEEALQFADAIAIGDAETVWTKIVEDARAGKLQRVYQSPPNLETEGVVPDRRIFEGKQYRPLHLVQVGRGCKYACDFCSIHAFYGKAMPRRCLEDVLAEMEELRGKYVFFADDNLFNDLDYAEKLFEALIPYNIHWSCQVSLDIAQNPHLLDLMAKSGCIGCLIGFESLDETNLVMMRKKWNLKYGGYANTLARFYERNIMVFGSFVLGYDNDTTDSFARTFDFAMESKLALAQFNPLIPTPATSLFERLKKEERLIYPRWWLDDDYRYGQTIFRPKKMTPEQLAEGCFKMRRDFGAYSSIFKRLVSSGANSGSLYNMFGYMAINLASIKEIMNKQGESLGNGMPLDVADLSLQVPNFNFARVA
ncbi:MAG: B12-binding domain-containing radical SAM protein [Anaerolineales bacterium]|nr:B12-binding domain-containing radical SAM protein [Anaerolineales bacterium]